jgi:cob(I)alamin adenosyltransferase
MVVLTKIYTKTGDDGSTALGTGLRLKKTHPRIAAYGTVDETNAAIGLASVLLGDTEADRQAGIWLAEIQNDLFDLGADLCVPDNGQPLPYTPLRMVESQVLRLERQIDAMNAQMKPLASFVLPGGSKAGAALHVARTVCRRAERAVIELSEMEGESVSRPVREYMNRLSDFLFVVSRFVNDKGSQDVLWKPGANREQAG